MDGLPGSNPDALPGTLPEDLPGFSPDDYASHTRIGTSGHSNPGNPDPPGKTYSNEALYRCLTLISTLWPETTPAAEHARPEFCNLYNAIKKHNLPNFWGARIPLNSGLKISSWRNYLHDYHDVFLCEFLTFGWPLGYNLQQPPHTTKDNHPSALAHTQAVNHFIQTEIDYNAMEGPFISAPFQQWFRISPLIL